jgi:putative phosphoesterase
MKIAVLSDVHANLPALKAVYEHARMQNTDAIYCLGDIVNQNVWNNEVVDFVRIHKIPCVRGNHDEGIGNGKKNYPFSFGSKEENQWGKEAIQFTLKQINEENQKFLRDLPLRLNLRIETTSGAFSICMTHGTLNNNHDRIYRFNISESVVHSLNENNVHLLLIGNTHVSFHKIIKQEIDSIPTVFRHIINPGSVGCPKDGSWHASYAVLEIDTTKDMTDSPDSLKVEFFRLDYDIDTVIKAIKNSSLSLYYAGRLLKY